MKANVEKNVNELKSDNASLKVEIAHNAKKLESDMVKLKADVEKNAKELKSDMKTTIKVSRNEIISCVGAFESRVEEVEKLTAAVPQMVQAVVNKLSESSEKLEELDDKVNLNSANITVLENSVQTLSKRKDEQPASHSSLQLPHGDNGSSIAEAMAKQARFNTVLQLKQSPTMIFGGELYKYVQFITMFRNSLTIQLR